MPVIASAQCPLLFSTSISSANDPTQVRRNTPVSASAATSRGAGVDPVRATLCGDSRSLLKIVSVAACAPRLPGRSRTTTSIAAPGSTASGYDATEGTTKSGDDDVMLAISSRLKPVLLMVRIWSLNEPVQTRPKSPLPGTAVTMIGAGASAASSRKPSMLPQPVQASQPGPAV